MRFGNLLTIGAFAGSMLVAAPPLSRATDEGKVETADPSSTIDAIGRICDQVHVCAPRPMQRGVERALRELPAPFYDHLRRDYERRRDQFCGALAAAGAIQSGV